MRFLLRLSRADLFRKSCTYECNYQLGICTNISRCLSTVNSSKSLDWNRIYSDAERVVGYSTSYLSLRCLLTDEISNLAAHVRKLVGTGHPLLKTAKRLIYNGQNYTHTRGLIILLISKSAGHKDEKDIDNLNKITDGISYRQRSLAELTEMIHMAHEIHRGVVNVTDLLFPDKNTAQDMDFGNKIAVLCGDYLLASASKILSTLQDTKVVELITSAIRHFPQAEFIGEHDPQGNAISYPGMNIKSWEDKIYLQTASLLALSCQSALILAKHDENYHQEAFLFGKNVALGWQVHSELQPFVDEQKHPPGKPFDLTSIPVVIHLQNDEDLLDYIRKRSENLDNVDYKLVRDAVLSSSAVDEAINLRHIYAKNSLNALKIFKETEATVALTNIVNVLWDQTTTEKL